MKEGKDMKNISKTKLFNWAASLLLTTLLMWPCTLSAFGAEKSHQDTAADGFTYRAENGGAVITGYIGSEDQIIIPSQIDGLNVSAIGKEAFYKNKTITSVVIPDTVTEIKTGAFYGCEKLSSAELSEGLKIIGRNAFQDCISLKEITIPSGVEKIAPWTFSGCTELSTINITGSLSEIGFKAFDNTAYFNDGGNWEDNMLYLGDHLIAADKNIKQPKLKDDTKSISNSVFAECTNLTCIEIPPQIEFIGISAFDGCVSLENLSMSQGIKKIGKTAFRRCESLRTVIIPETVTSVESSAFAGCLQLETVYIPGSVTCIGSDAFGGCPNLTICAPESSYAQTYAEEQGISFVSCQEYEAAASCLTEYITAAEEPELETDCGMDFNGDGAVTVSDATFLQQRLARTEASAAFYEDFDCDVNKDGKFDVIDVTAIQLFISGLSSL